MPKLKQVTIEIPGTFNEAEILKISDARNACLKMSNGADHVADAGAQLYVSFRGHLDELDLPLKFEVSQVVFQEICVLAGRVNL